MFSPRHIVTSILLFAALTITTSARAQVPTLFVYEGYLEQAGVPVTDTVAVVFALHDAQSGGASIWTETHSMVSVTGGFFTAIVGDVTALDADTVLAYPFLSVTIDGDTLGRQELLSVPFASVAGQVSWTDLTDVPVGFADGVDDVSSGGGGGTVTQVAVGSGLTASPDPITVNGTISVDFTAVAAAVHSHDSDYFTETEADARFASASHAHDGSYYTESEANALFSAAGHDHDADYYTESEADGLFVAKQEKMKTWWVGGHNWIADRDNFASYNGPCDQCINCNPASSDNKFACNVYGGLLDLGADISSMQPQITIFLDGMPDLVTITEWGLQLGQNAGTGTQPEFVCDLRDSDVSANGALDTLTIPDRTGNDWRYAVTKTASIAVDQAAYMDADSDGVPPAWQVRCAGPSGDYSGGAQWYFHQVYVKYVEN